MATAINILREYYPDVVDACEVVSKQQERSLAQVAARAIRQALKISPTSKTQVLHDDVNPSNGVGHYTKTEAACQSVKKHGNED